MVSGGGNTGGSEWVAFENGQPNGEPGFETIVRTTEAARPNRGDSARRRKKDSSSPFDCFREAALHTQDTAAHTVP